MDVSPADVFQAEIRALEGAITAANSNRFRIMAIVMAELESKLIVTGVGKSAIAARKIAATLATCTVPAVFLDPVGLFHGELGLLRSDDVVLMISKSGETEELIRLLPKLERLGCVVFSIVGDPKSTLGRRFSLATGCLEEPFANIPTASSAAAVALGDCLATTAAQLKQLGQHQLAEYHPGGTIGALREN